VLPKSTTSNPIEEALSLAAQDGVAVEMDVIPVDGEEAPLSDEDLEAQAKEEARAAQDREDTLTDLAAKIEGLLKQRANNRKFKELEWLECTRLNLGALSYALNNSTPENPFDDSVIQRRRPTINIVSAKCEIAISQCVSMQFGAGEKNWDLWPSANSSNPDDETKCKLMSDEIETQLDKCRYGFEARQAIEDRVLLGTGILKGPVNTGSLCREYKPSPDGETWLPEVTVEHYPEVVRVNPWLFFPDDTTNDPDKVQDSIELHPMSKVELSRYRNHQGFNLDAITEVLKQTPTDYCNSNFTEYARITDSNPYLFKDKYAVIEYHGPITSEELDKLDIQPTYNSPTEEYYGEVWICQGRVIRIELENLEAYFEIPYAISIWKKDPSSVFGFGQPLTMRDAQRVATTTWHMILDNSSLSSGPQAGIQRRWISPADGSWEMSPQKMWNLTDPTMRVGDAIQFFNVPNVTEHLVPILNLAREFAQEESSTPLMTAGLTGANNQESATGQLISDKNSTVLLDFQAEAWDDQITTKIITRMYGWNMQYNKKPEIKGNYVIDVRSSTEYKNKQIYIRDLERLSVESSQNPEMAAAVDTAALTKARLDLMHLPNRTIVRTEEQIKQIAAEKSNQPNPQMIELQIKKQEADTNKMAIELKARQLDFDAKQQQQREQWDHEEKMAANYARTVESNAMVLRAQTEKETEMIKASMQSQDAQMKQKMLLQANMDNNDTKSFIASMQENRKARENLLYEQELKLKAQTGSGV